MAFELNLAHMSISDLLEMASEKNELIYVRERQKCLGKTASLIQFARKNNCPILMITGEREETPDTARD